MEIVANIAKVVFIPVIVLNFIPLLIWFERKGAAYIQDRRGPNRAQIFGIRLGGIIHNLADVIKLLCKEEFIPAGANRFYFVLSPLIIMFVYIVTTAVIPFGDLVRIGETAFSLQIADLNVGILYLFAFSSLAVYGIMLAGWSSNNKYSFLGGLRASSQMVSYEISMGLSIMSLFMVAESLSLQQIVQEQGNLPWHWFVVRQPLAFLLFTVAIFAETNRTPFDLPEGESELVAGFHVEYSSMKFALFFMAEYAAMVVGSAVIVSLFFGGWQVPFLSTADLIEGAPFLTRVLLLGLGVLSVLGGLLLVIQFRPHKYGDLRDFEVLTFGVPALLVGAAVIAFLFLVGLPVLPNWYPPVFAAICQVITFLIKVALFCFFFVWVRWTVPRFRYDQLMGFGWKGMLPLSLVNLFVTGLYLLFRGTGF
ncbi:MAG: NADH-quinone oxidoreductase subunit H [Deltaproteobacteria bacterium]|nr:NADH-quinone oxidoreductase subunit H [Deltaproteobacteria bacterium]MBI2500533.1 NADH-quinone oxidoreductase subunit H [Deltaproteobacteria bacterium]MBI4197413.1 NADH-quinone oxidoreductase subunit H [Deltaproteobacteria bacterium]